MVAEGVATSDDVARWGAAFDRLDATANLPDAQRVMVFVAQFAALGRRPHQR